MRFEINLAPRRITTWERVACWFFGHARVDSTGRCIFCNKEE